jgi:hypothetical protein
VSVALGTWSFLKLQAERQAALESVATLAQCRALAEEIKALRGGPQEANVVAPSTFHPATYVQGVAESTHLPQECIAYVRVGSTQRVGESVYMGQSVLVPLKGVAMPQVIQFLQACAVASPELRTKELRLTLPARSNDGIASNQLWDADLTLTYFTVSRKTPQPKS